MSYEFRVLQTPERRLLAVHDQARNGGELPLKIKAHLDEVWAYLRANGAKFGHHPIAASTWEEYGDWTNDTSKLRTQVYVVVAR
ncbi:MAG TPA: hypothetical protein VG963_13160 [Polyangiaceae bacterium]|nr:hypothetical protein [Polyangiaceae bacterium]